ncbi:RecB family exonuclease [Sphaerisporangium aureirubrum]|uniref:RecB family exonuclease n=1 Tax=Sphaerisporangium aureirubrum TaxID=1544736 RepID=A0ABW1NE71_9ACTN
MRQLGLELEGMPKRLYSCTPSRLNTWLDCPRRYRFTYLDRPAPPKGPPWAHNSVGASVHNALAAWWREPYDRRTPAVAGILLTRGWITEGFRDQDQSTEWRDRSRELVMGYTSTLDPSDEPVGVERTVATRTSVIAVSGRVDRIDRRGDELVIVDYKTGRRPLTEDDARSSLALALYAICASRVLHRPCRQVELHHLPTASTATWQHTDATLQRHLSRAEDLAQEASQADEDYRALRDSTAPARTRTTASSTSSTTEAPAVAPPAPGTPSATGSATASPRGGELRAKLDERFPAHPGPICSWCDYRQHCPEGQAAGTPRQPWDALVDLREDGDLKATAGNENYRATAGNENFKTTPGNEGFKAPAGDGGATGGGPATP